MVVPQGREAITAKLVANMITESGCDRVLAMDLHSGQCVGYFDMPVDHVQVLGENEDRADRQISDDQKKDGWLQKFDGFEIIDAL